MSLVAGFGGQIAAAAERVQTLDGRFLALALALQLGMLGFRALAWRGVLAASYPGQRVPVFRLGCAYAAGVALNAFLPARGGEGAKVGLARMQIAGSSVATIAASLSVVLVLDTILGASLIAAFWGMGLVPALPSIPSVGVAPLVAGVALAVAAAAALTVRRATSTARRLLASAARGVAVLRDPRLYARTVLPYQLAAWGCRIGVVFLVLHAFHIEAGLTTAALVVVLSGVSTAVPVPGGAGSQQILAAYALQGVASTAGALSFSVGMQIGVTVVNTAVGLAAAMLLFRTLRPIAAVRTASTRPAR